MTSAAAARIASVALREQRFFAPEADAHYSSSGRVW